MSMWSTRKRAAARRSDMRANGVALLLLMLSLVLAAPVGAAPPTPDEERERVAAAAHADADHRAREEREKRATPQAREERERSRSRYRGLPAAELARNEYPRVVGGGTTALSHLGQGAVKRYVSPRSALVDDRDGRPSLALSEFPLTTPTGEAVDISIKKDGAGFAPTRPLVDLAIGGRVGEPLRFGDGEVSVTPVGAADVAGATSTASETGTSRAMLGSPTSISTMTA